MKKKRKPSTPPRPTVAAELKSAMNHLDRATEALTSDADLILIHRTLLGFLKDIRL